MGLLPCHIHPRAAFSFRIFHIMGMHLANISISLSIMAGIYHDNIRLRKVAGVFQEISFISQLTIVCIYWSILHQVVIDIQKPEIAKAKGEDFAEAFHSLMISIHLIPAVTVFINISISRIVFIASHYKYMIHYSVLYAITNYIGVIIKGSPLYHFLPWTDFRSLIVILVIMSGNLTAYYFVCKFIRKFKLNNHNITKVQKAL